MMGKQCEICDNTDLNPKLSNIKINYFVMALIFQTIFKIPIDNYEYFNNDIRIKGCYINPTVDYKQRLQELKNKLRCYFNVKFRI